MTEFPCPHCSRDTHGAHGICHRCYARVPNCGSCGKRFPMSGAAYTSQSINPQCGCAGPSSEESHLAMKRRHGELYQPKKEVAKP